jgi:hypothetical protein
LSQWRRLSIRAFRRSSADRLAHVAFVTSVNRTNEGKTAQEARDATQADEDAYEAASGIEEDAVSETEG